MDIRASLVLDNLKERFSILRFGRRNDTPLLRPIFYSKSGEVEKNRIYVTRPDNLPPKESMDSSMLLICAEGLPSLAYQHSNIPMFVIRDSSIMEVFNEILSIFERYEIWEKSLNTILSTSADISELIQITAPLLMNDITVLNKDWRVMAAANYKRNAKGIPEVIHYTELMEAMPLDIANKYRQGFREHKNKRGSFFADEGCYCTNLYLDDQYWGNASLFPMLSPLRESDPYIFEILTDAILKALHINTVSVKKETSILEDITRKMLDGVAVDHEKIISFEAAHSNISEGRFLFLCIQLPDDLQKISHDYLSQSLHNRFPNMIIFQYEGHFAGIKDFANCRIGCEEFLSQLEKDLGKFGLKAGTSNRFRHLRHTRSYYQQALWALELGLVNNPEHNLYYFRDYALRYMMLNSCGSFTSRYLCPKGLLALQQYNAGSEVDYWHTLRTYLDSERNIARTAKALNIHRNTMIQRIERIESTLCMDLDDPMTRLWLRMAIWLVDEEHNRL